MDNLDEIKDILKENTQAIVNLDRKIYRLVTVVEGDERAGIDGYGKRLKKVENYVSVDKKLRWVERFGIGAFLAYIGLR